MVIDVPTTLVEVIDSDDDFRQDGWKVSHYKKEQSFFQDFPHPSNQATLPNP